MVAIAAAFARSRPIVKFAIAFVALELALALLAPLVAPYDPLRQNIVARLKPPSAAFWLGTDQFGRDNLSRILNGARTSLLVSGLAVSLALVLGGTLGLMLWGRLGWARSLRVCLPLADASPAIAAMASVALLTGALPPWMAASLLLASAVASIMEPRRRGTAAQLERSAHGA